VTNDQRVVAKQDIQEVESAKRAGASCAHHRNQAKNTNMKLRQQLANAPRARQKTYKYVLYDAVKGKSSFQNHSRLNSNLSIGRGYGGQDMTYGSSLEC
jgi:hypothetical protein